MTATPVAGDGKHQRCDQCGHVAPFADLDMQYGYGIGVEIECRDGVACKARKAVQDWRPDVTAVVDALAALGINAEADEPYADDDDFASLFIGPEHLADSDAEGMCVGWDADNGWTFNQWRNPDSGTSVDHYLDAADPTDPSKIAERVKAILDGTVDGYQPLPPQVPWRQPNT